MKEMIGLNWSSYLFEIKISTQQAPNILWWHCQVAIYVAHDVTASVGCVFRKIVGIEEVTSWCAWALSDFSKDFTKIECWTNLQLTGGKAGNGPTEASLRGGPPHCALVGSCCACCACCACTAKLCAAYAVHCQRSRPGIKSLIVSILVAPQKCAACSTSNCCGSTFQVEQRILVVVSLFLLKKGTILLSLWWFFHERKLFQLCITWGIFVQVFCGRFCRTPNSHLSSNVTLQRWNTCIHSATSVHHGVPTYPDPHPTPKFTEQNLDFMTLSVVVGLYKFFIEGPKLFDHTCQNTVSFCHTKAHQQVFFSFS